MLPQLRGDEALRYSYGVPPAPCRRRPNTKWEAAVYATNAGDPIRRLWARRTPGSTPSQTKLMTSTSSGVIGQAHAPHAQATREKHLKRSPFHHHHRYCVRSRQSRRRLHRPSSLRKTTCVWKTSLRCKGQPRASWQQPIRSKSAKSRRSLKRTLQQQQILVGSRHNRSRWRADHLPIKCLRWACTHKSLTT